MRVEYCSKRTIIKVNADDFGIDENRTCAILEAFRMGAISQTTAMVNMPYFSEAVGMIRSAGFLNRMGLHLNLTEGPAMTSAMRKCRFFCDGDGCFTGDFHRTIKYRLGLPCRIKPIVYGEIEAQIKKFVSCCSGFLHLDSHHHVHTDYSIANILLPIAVANGFKSVRLSRNLGEDISWPKRLYKKALNSYLQFYINGSTEYCTDFHGLIRGCERVPSGSSVEVMVHPMFGVKTRLDIDGELTDGGHLISEELAFYKNSRSKFQFVRLSND